MAITYYIHNVMIFLSYCLTLSSIKVSNAQFNSPKTSSPKPLNYELFESQISYLDLRSETQASILALKFRTWGVDLAFGTWDPNTKIKTQGLNV